MRTKETESKFQHRQVIVNGISTHLVETENKEKQVIFFLHGYPETWMAFEKVMMELIDDYALLAIDLPGVGTSEKIATSDKKTIARFINEVIQHLNLKNIILAGHDVGGMIAYSFLRYYPENLAKVIIMDTAIPGIEPWEEVKRNPYIWHFAFYAVPSLPETLATGKQRALFDFFYDNLSVNKNAINEDKKDLYAAAYEKASSLKTSFDWYRAFPQDEKDNAGHSAIDIPVLYLRGEKDYGNIENYLQGCKKSGISNIIGKLIPQSGHFAPEENSKAVAKEINYFIKGGIAS